MAKRAGTPMNAGGRTPSDFPAARVSQADLDQLLAKIGRSGDSGTAARR